MGLYSVNGKEPIAAWIPSRDTAGNGTTTLTDLVGSINGTLTNMDAATDWVSDTGAGGVRALDFDGSNDNVNLGSRAWVNAVASISLWVKLASISGNQFFFDGSSDAGDGKGMSIRAMSDGKIRYWHYSAGNGGLDSTTTLTVGVWYHLVGSFDGTTSRLFVNGVQEASRTGDSVNAVSNTYLIGRSPMFAGTVNGRLDDVRLFYGVSLVTADAEWLYYAGSGRGRQNASSDFETVGMFGGMSGAMTGGMAS